MRVFERLGIDTSVECQYVVELNHEQRDKGRLKVHAQDGTEVCLFLERGKSLQVGEVLLAESGEKIRIAAANEAVLKAWSDDWTVFSRACYHLGNRHVRVQVGERCLWITPDHVLEEMLQLLGLQTEHVNHVFVPEAGAYAGGHHHH